MIAMLRIMRRCPGNSLKKVSPKWQESTPTGFVTDVESGGRQKLSPMVLSSAKSVDLGQIGKNIRRRWLIVADTSEWPLCVLKVLISKKAVTKRKCAMATLLTRHMRGFHAAHNTQGGDTLPVLGKCWESAG